MWTDLVQSAQMHCNIFSIIKEFSYICLIDYRNRHFVRFGYNPSRGVTNKYNNFWKVYFHKVTENAINNNIVTWKAQYKINFEAFRKDCKVKMHVLKEWFWSPFLQLLVLVYSRVASSHVTLVFLECFSMDCS